MAQWPPPWYASVHGYNCSTQATRKELSTDPCTLTLIQKKVMFCLKIEFQPLSCNSPGCSPDTGIDNQNLALLARPFL